ncbi:MAG: hypothetical protein LUH51_00890, partial [Firmicutes bacterium]|nr:hypothetical protein [Bacillota bacterium]
RFMGSGSHLTPTFIIEPFLPIFSGFGSGARRRGHFLREPQKRYRKNRLFQRKIPLQIRTKVVL